MTAKAPTKPVLHFKRCEEDAAYRDDMRHRFITDHFFTAEVMFPNGSWFHPIIHKPAVKLYFPKNSKKPIVDQHPKKNRLHLDPRFSLKTTLGRVDDLQWLCAFPKDLKMLNQTATQPLARAISKVEADYFWRRKGQTQLTGVQILFPELIVDREPFSGNRDEEWNIPTHDMWSIDPTIAYTSPKSVQSGWHPNVLNSDDLAETNNSGLRANPEIRQGVIGTYKTNKNTLTPGGYNNVRGTRYHPFDLYGDMIEKMNPDEWETCIRGSLTMKDGTRLQPGVFPTRDEMILNFADIPGLSYKDLQTKFYDDYEVFMCQQMNDPLGGNTPLFEESKYNACTFTPDRVPAFGGQVFVCWRLPYGDSPATSKYYEGAAARILDGRVYVIDCWQGVYKPSTAAERIVQAAKTHSADGLMLIDTPGSNYMATQIRNEAARRNYSTRVQWVTWHDEPDARLAEINQMEPLMKAGRLLFSEGMNKPQECKKQFVHYGLVEETGIIECVAKFANLIPMSQLRAQMEDDEIEYAHRFREQALVNHHLQQMGTVQVEDQAVQMKARAHMKAMERTNGFSLPRLPGGLRG